MVTAQVAKVTANQLILEFTDSQRAVTPGQAVVLYQDEEVLGGGTIKENNEAIKVEKPAADLVTN